MSDWTDRRYAVVDVEGNGQHPPGLVELAVVPITGGRIGEPTCWLVKPDQPITAMARRIHGISNELAAAAPPFTDVQADVRAHLDGAVLVAHNAGVDLGVLHRVMPGFAPADMLDTLTLARRLLRDQPTHRLGSLVTALHLNEGLPDGPRPHRAAYDALVTARLFVRLATNPDGTPMSFAELRGGSGHDALF